MLESFYGLTACKRKKGTALRPLFVLTMNSAKENADVSYFLASYLKVSPSPRTLRRWTVRTSCHRRRFPSAPCCQPGRCWWNIHSRPGLSLPEEPALAASSRENASRPAPNFVFFIRVSFPFVLASRKQIKILHSRGGKHDLTTF